MTHQPLVTIIVVPREKFSCSLQSLDSIIEHSEHPYELIYVDARSPRHIREAIAERCERHGFKLIRSERFLPTNAARNLALIQARGKYVVFVENDVVVSADWLAPLVDCAEATGATVVSPLICQGTPLHTYIHCAGGRCGIRVKEVDGRVERRLYEQISKQKQLVSKVLPTLDRALTELAEFHCMMIRKEYLDQHGSLDEQVVNTREHVDFCLEVAQDGGTIWLEPASIVTYLYDTPLEGSDLSFFMMRWSDRWARSTLARLEEKHELTRDEQAVRQRMQVVRWRRKTSVIRPLLRRATRGVGGRWVEKGLEGGAIGVERLVSSILHAVNDRRSPSARA